MQAYFERALAVARQQQAKSWELRAANHFGAPLGGRISGYRGLSRPSRDETRRRRSTIRSSLCTGNAATLRIILLP